MTTRLLTLRDVTAMTALSRSAVYALMAESRFPKPIRIGARAVRWVEQEVADFIASRPRAGSERGAGWPRRPGRGDPPTGPHRPAAMAQDGEREPAGERA